MKIINAQTGQLETIPLVLGEAGRGHWRENVDVARQSDRAPQGADAVGYFTIQVPTDPRTGKRPSHSPEQHIVLTRPVPGQSGLLVRINTAGCYTRGSHGAITLHWGSAEELTRGTWAHGDAGRLCDGPDAIWHVRGPALFSVVLAGGTGKGYGRRYLVVTPELRTSFWKPTDLVRVLATGEDVAIARVCRDALAAQALPETLAEALATMDAIESADPPAPAQHFWRYGALVYHLPGLAVPAGWTQEQGVSGIRSGMLVPGDGTLVCYGIDSGGGKRWSLRDFGTRGLTEIADDVYLVSAPDWAITGTQYKDGEPDTTYWADATGIYYCPPNEFTSFVQSWEGRTEPAPITLLEMQRRANELLAPT